jgi:hypothetical protein
MTVEWPPEERYEQAVISGDFDWCRAMRAAHAADPQLIAAFDRIDAERWVAHLTTPLPPRSDEREG